LRQASGVARLAQSDALHTVCALSAEPFIGRPHQVGGLAWWVWLLLALGAAAVVAGSLLISLPAWLSTGVARLNPGRRPAVRKRLKDRRPLALLYAGLATAGLFVLVVWVLPPYLTRHPVVSNPADRHKAITDTRTGLIAALAALGAAGGLAFTARTYRLSREGHVTDRYSKAIEQLGNDKTEIRLGGIYALERLMRDSPHDQPTIIEVLAAYVRQHTSLSQPPAARTHDRRVAGYRHTGPMVRSERPAEDVQAALTVLGRRTPVAAEQPIDLRNTHLHAATLGEANLTDAWLNGANLTDARLGKANLTDAWLDEANLTDAWLGKANLTDAQLGGANLTNASLDLGALTEVQLAAASHTDLISWFPARRMRASTKR